MDGGLKKTCIEEESKLETTREEQLEETKEARPESKDLRGDITR